MPSDQSLQLLSDFFQSDIGKVLLALFASLIALAFYAIMTSARQGKNTNKTLDTFITTFGGLLTETMKQDRTQSDSINSLKEETRQKWDAVLRVQQDQRPVGEKVLKRLNAIYKTLQTLNENFNNRIPEPVDTTIHRHVSASQKAIIDAMAQTLKMGFELRKGRITFAPDGVTITSMNQDAVMMFNCTADLSRIPPETMFYRKAPDYEVDRVPMDQTPMAVVAKTKVALTDVLIGVRCGGRSAITWIVANAEPEFNEKKELQSITLQFNDVNSILRVARRVIDTSEAPVSSVQPSQ
jgi:hypothetical protein